MKISVLATVRSGHNFIIQNIRSWFKEDIKVIDIEDVTLDNIQFYDTKRSDYKIIVVRSFLNFLASVIKWEINRNGLTEETKSRVVRRVLIYNEILEEITSPKHFNADLVIFYDRFCKDQVYRQYICKQLNGEYNENKLNYVSEEGNGSSFDGFSYQGKGSKMKTTDRFLQIEDEHKVIFEEIVEQNKDVLNKYLKIIENEGTGN